MKKSRFVIPMLLCLLLGCHSPQHSQRLGRLGEVDSVERGETQPEIEDTQPPLHSVWPDRLADQSGFLPPPHDAFPPTVEQASFVQADGATPNTETLQPPVAEAGTRWTLAQLQEFALASQPAIAQAAAKVAALHGKWLQAGLAPNPSIGYSGEEMGDTGTAGQQGGFVRQQFIRGNKLGLDRAVLSEEIDKAEQQLAAQRQRVLTDIGTSFYEVLIAQRKLELANELLGISDRAVETSQQLLQAKEIPLIGLLQTQIVARNARIVKRRAENEKTAVWRRLTSVLGHPDMRPQQLEGELELELVANELHWNDQLARLLAESPEIAIAATELSRARWALDRAHAEVIPDLSVQVVVQHGNVTGDTIASVQVQVPAPLWNKNQGGIEQARSEITAADRNINRVELDLRQRLAAAFQRYSDARYQVTEFSEEVLPKAKQTFDLVTRGYEQGEVGYLDLLTAQRTYFQTSLSYIDAVRDLWRAVIHIDGLLLDGSLERGADA